MAFRDSQGWTTRALSVVALAIMAQAFAQNPADPLATPSPSPDDPAIVRTLKKNAEQGDADAQYAVGLLHHLGEGLAKDPAKAKAWMTQAAEQGDPRAQNFLGLMLDPTWNKAPQLAAATSKKRAEEAAGWYRRAAAQGFEPAVFNLERLRIHGLIEGDTRSDVLLTRASLASSSLEMHKTPVKATAKSLFKALAGSIAEITGPVQYGSGVVLGKFDPRHERLEMADQSFRWPVRMLDKSKKERVQFAETALVVLTNGHVLEGLSRTFVALGSTENGESLLSRAALGTCGAKREGLDLAFLFVPFDAEVAALGLRPFEIYNLTRKPEKGEVVFAMGNPERLSRTVTQGLFNGFREEGIQFDAAISQGSSGGALVDDSGRLLGVTTGFSAEEGSQNLNFAVPYGEIESLMQNADALDCATLPR